MDIVCQIIVVFRFSVGKHSLQKNVQPKTIFKEKFNCQLPLMTGVNQFFIEINSQQNVCMPLFVVFYVP